MYGGFALLAHSLLMKVIQAKSILVRVSARFELSGVSCTTSTSVEERLEIWTVNNA